MALVPLPAFSDARIAAERDDDPDPADPPPAPAGPVRATRAPRALAATRRRTAGRARPGRRGGPGRRPVSGLPTGPPAVADRALAERHPDVHRVRRRPTRCSGSANCGPRNTPQLDWANSITTGVLTGMRLTGWKRNVPGPVISPYAGDKAAIPTDGTLSFEPVNVVAHRHAVGADFDRIWLDFGDESVIRTWLQLVTQDYAKKLDAAIGALILTEATDGGDAAGRHHRGVHRRADAEAGRRVGVLHRHRVRPVGRLTWPLPPPTPRGGWRPARAWTWPAPPPG